MASIHVLVGKMTTDKSSFLHAHHAAPPVPTGAACYSYVLQSCTDYCSSATGVGKHVFPQNMNSSLKNKTTKQSRGRGEGEEDFLFQTWEFVSPQTQGHLRLKRRPASRARPVFKSQNSVSSSGAPEARHRPAPQSGTSRRPRAHRPSAPARPSPLPLNRTNAGFPPASSRASPGRRRRRTEQTCSSPARPGPSPSDKRLPA